MTFTENVKFDDAMIHPDAYTTAPVSGTWARCADYSEIVVLVALGTMNIGATVTFKAEQAQDASGTGKKDVPGASISMVQASGDDRAAYSFQINPHQIDTANGYDHIRVYADAANASLDYGVHLLRIRPGHAPVDNS